jgi:hypothetical protein
MRREFTADGTEYAEITGGKEWPKESSSIFFGSFSASSVDSASSAVFQIPIPLFSFRAEEELNLSATMSLNRNRRQERKKPKRYCYSTLWSYNRYLHYRENPRSLPRPGSARSIRGFSSFPATPKAGGNPPPSASFPRCAAVIAHSANS